MNILRGAYTWFNQNAVSRIYKLLRANELQKPTFEIANVRMMNSENGSLLLSETSMSPKVNDPSFGQYWIHFVCLNLY